MAIFFDFLGDSLDVFMDVFSVFGEDLDSCLANLTKILEVCVIKLGEIPLYGVRGSSAWACCLEERTRGG